MKTAPELLGLEGSKRNVLSKRNRNPNKPRFRKNKQTKKGNSAHVREKANKLPLSYHTCTSLSPSIYFIRLLC